MIFFGAIFFFFGNFKLLTEVSVFYTWAFKGNVIVCDLKEDRADNLTVYFKVYEIILEDSSSRSSAGSC